MKSKKEENKNHLYLGIFFLILEVFVFIRNGQNYLNFLWFCNIAPIFFALTLLSKKIQLTKALINIALVPDAFFLIDFFSSIFFNFGIFGRVQPYFQESFLYILTTVLIHLTAFLALTVTYKTKPDKETFFYSSYLVLGLYLATLILSPLDGYYNYIYTTRPGYIRPSIPYVIITILWPALVFALLVLPSQAIQYFIYRINLKFKKRN